MMDIDKNGKVSYKDVIAHTLFLLAILFLVLSGWQYEKQQNIIEQHTYTENGTTYRYTLEIVN